jgi:uncharacterized membrane protein YphA (DoxX/SURF4 family)
MKAIMTICRIIAGLVFVFSGFVKAIDPMGSAIKFEEYFMAFHMDFFAFTALPLAVILSALELMIGLSLLARLRMRFTATMLLIFMTFFLILTLILALTNPVTDCGCFGDAVKLTNWQTFGKNVILFIPALIIFLKRRDFRTVSNPFTEWYLVGVNFIFPVLLSVFCIVHQPVIDFRPYKPGVSISESMTLPRGAEMDKYETILIYEKNGLKKEFSETNYPWQDTTWKWVETKQNLISMGDVPPIHDFSITDTDGNDITEKVLSDTGYSFLIIAPKLEKASEKGLAVMNKLSEKAINMGFQVYCLTSSSTSGISEFIENFRPAFNVFTTDETTLKTIIRANPGLMLIHEGTILGKWNYNDSPTPEELETNMLKVVLRRNIISTETFSVMLIIMIISFFYAAFYLAFVNKNDN